MTDKTRLEASAAILVAVIIIIALILPALFGIQIGEGNIRIGAILPLSGPVSIFGDWARDGMELALEDINSDRIEIIYEDSKLDAKEGVSAFNKLVTVDDADIIISAMSSVSVPLIPLSEENNIPLFLQDVTAPNITVGNPLVLRHFIQSDREASVLAGYALEELRISRVGILYVNDEAGVGAKEAFKDIFEEKAGEVLALESYGTKDMDMKTQILKIKESGAEGIYLFGNGPSWAQALKQIKELGFEGKILTNTAIFIKNFRDAAGNATEDVYFTYPYANMSNENVQNFIAKYREKYGEDPAIEAYYAWDIIHVIAEVLKKNNWETEGLENIIIDMKEFEGAFGKTIITGDGEFLTPVGIAVIENGRIKELYNKW